MIISDIKSCSNERMLVILIREKYKVSYEVAKETIYNELSQIKAVIF